MGKWRNSKLRIGHREGFFDRVTLKSERPYQKNPPPTVTSPIPLQVSGSSVHQPSVGANFEAHSNQIRRLLYYIILYYYDSPTRLCILYDYVLYIATTSRIHLIDDMLKPVRL
jgi:hypothetical protein